jgi:hypothetical protein
LWDVKIYFRGFSMEGMLSNTAQTMRSSSKGYCFFVRQLLFFFLYSFFLLPQKECPYSILQEVLISSAFRKVQQPGS